MERAIVTGATGFVGNALVRELVSRDVEVIAVVRDKNMENVAPERKEILTNSHVKLVEAEISRIDTLLTSVKDKVDVYYGLAWDGLRNEALLDYNLQVDNIKHVIGQINVAAALGCKKFIGAGSIAQYELFEQDQNVGSGDKHYVYKAAKYACQIMGQQLTKGTNMEFIWPIITNIFGPGEKSPRLINSTIRNLFLKGEQDFSEGNQIYDFIYIDDAAHAFFLLGEYGKRNRTYVIANGTAKPLKEFFVNVPAIMDRDVKLNWGKMKFNGYYLDKQRYSIDELVEDTGFSPECTFDEGFAKTVEWIRKEME